MWTSPGWAAKTRSAQPLMIRLEAALLQPHWLLHFNVNAQREWHPPSKAPHQSNTNIYTSLYGSLKLTQPCFLCSRSAPETQYNDSIRVHVSGVHMKPTGRQSPLAGPHFITVCLWVTQAKQSVCLLWLQLGTHDTCQCGQNRPCSKLIMCRLCSLTLFFRWRGGGCVSRCVASEWLLNKSKNERKQTFFSSIFLNENPKVIS